MCTLPFSSWSLLCSQWFWCNYCAFLFRVFANFDLTQKFHSLPNPYSSSKLTLKKISSTQKSFFFLLYTLQILCISNIKCRIILIINCLTSCLSVLSTGSVHVVRVKNGLILFSAIIFNIQFNACYIDTRFLLFYVYTRNNANMEKNKYMWVLFIHRGKLRKLLSVFWISNFLLMKVVAVIDT